MLNQRSLSILSTIDLARGEFYLHSTRKYGAGFVDHFFSFELEYGGAKLKVETEMAAKGETWDDLILRCWEKIAPVVTTGPGRCFLGPALEHKSVEDEIPF